MLRAERDDEDFWSFPSITGKWLLERLSICRESLSSGEGLLPPTISAYLDPKRQTAMLADLCAFVQSLPGYHLSYPDSVNGSLTSHHDVRWQDASDAM